MGIAETNPVSQLSLPPGFRFYPTDEELLVQYLCRKIAGHHILEIIGEVDLYKHDPWVLPSKAVFGEKEWYFFSPRDRKYPNGSRPNRVAGSGYWKATGTDKIITTEGRKVGIKKALVFYIGKAPKGTKTNWIMHEYRLSESTKKSGSSRLDDWVLCRIYKKNSAAQKPVLSISTNEYSNGSSSSSSSLFDDVLESFPEISDRSFALPRMNSVRTLQDEKLNFQNLGLLGCGKFDRENQSFEGSLPEIVSNSQIQIHRPENNVYIPSYPPVYHVDSPSEKFGSSIEEEVESGFGTPRVDNSGFYQQNSNGFARTFSDSLDPFGFRFLTDPVSGKFAFGQ